MFTHLFVILLIVSILLNIILFAQYWKNRRVSFERSKVISRAGRDDMRRSSKEIVELQVAALNAAATAIAITDRNNIIQWVNPAFTQLTGYTFDESLGQSARILRSDKHSGAFYEHLQQTIESGLIWEDEAINVRKDGYEYVEQQTITPVKDSNGEINHYITIKQDCTARRRMEEKLRRQNNYLAALHQITLDLLHPSNLDDLLQSIVDRAAEFLDAPFCEIMFLEGDELVVRAFTRNQPFLTGDRIHREKASLSWQAFDTQRPIIVADYAHLPLRRQIYDELDLSAVIILPILIGDRCVGVLDISRSKPGHTYDDSEIQAATLFAQLATLAFHNASSHENLRQESIRDPLTGLFNRRFMEETLAKEISRAKRKSSPLTIAMFDLDHLKELNDTFGHHAGDDALSNVASLIKAGIRAGDIACRYGGDEFTLILTETTVQNARQRMEELLKNIRRTVIRHEGKTISAITLSVGIAGYPPHGVTGPELLKSADRALYRAKQAGRDQVVVF